MPAVGVIFSIMSIRYLPTFEQYLRDARQSGRMVNAVFEDMTIFPGST